MSFLSDYRIFTSGNEAHPSYHLWCGLVALSSIVSRRVWIEQGFFKIYPNLYVVLVGPPGNRKTTAMSICKTLLRELKEIPFSAECITKEALVRYMAEQTRAYTNPLTPFDKPQTYSPLTICVTELSQFVGSSNESMIDFLTTIYDQDFYEYKTKNKGEDSIEGPYLTVLGCTTPSWITARLKDDVISGGFSRRAIFVYETGRANRIAFPEVTAEAKEAWTRVVERSTKMLGLGGEFKWTAEASCWYKNWYENLEIPTDLSVCGYYESKHIQLLKLAMLISLSESEELLLHVGALQFALAILDEMEKNLPKVFDGIGRNELNQLASQVLEIVQMKNGKIKEKELLSIMFRDANEIEIKQVIQHLLESEKVKRGEIAVASGARVIYLFTPEEFERVKSQVQQKK